MQLYWFTTTRATDRAPGDLRERMAVASLEGVTARGLVSLERAETVLQAVIDIVNAQARQITGMNLMMQDLVSRDTFSSAMMHVEGAVSRLTRRLDNLESAMLVPGSDPSVPIGEVVGANACVLHSALDSLKRKADIDDVINQLCSIRERTEQELAQVYDWAAPRELVEKLDEAQRATRQHVQALEQTVACKLDKSELADLEAVCARIRAFDSTVHDSARRISRLEKAVEQTNTELHKEAAAMATLSDRVGRAEASLQHTASRQELARLQDEAVALVTQLANKADVTSFRRLEEATRRQQESIATLEADYRAWREEWLMVLGEFTRELQTTASLEQLDKKLDARIWDRHWRSATERLERKAEAKDLAGVSGRMAIAEEMLQRLQRESELAIRFVDWFSSREQSYEHNLHVLDRTLGRLARDSLPQRRQPYDGRVRFTTEAVFEAVGIRGVARGAAAGGGDAGASGEQTGQGADETPVADAEGRNGRSDRE